MVVLWFFGGFAFGSGHKEWAVAIAIVGTIFFGLSVLFSIEYRQLKYLKEGVIHEDDKH